MEARRRKLQAYPDQALYTELAERARKQRTSISEVAIRLIRRGLRAEAAPGQALPSDDPDKLADRVQELVGEGYTRPVARRVALAERRQGG